MRAHLQITHLLISLLHPSCSQTCRHARVTVRDYSCPPPPSSLTLSTLIEFSLMFDSSVLSARPPSRCRLPRRFLPPPALASAPVLPISDSLSSGAPSLLYSLSFVCSQMYFCLLLHGPHHKASLRNWRWGPERVEFLIIYSSSTTLEDASPVKTLTILQFKDQKPI